MQQAKTTPSSASALLISEGSTTGRRDQNQKELRHHQHHHNQQQPLFKFRYRQHPSFQVHYQNQLQFPNCDNPSGRRSTDDVCAVTSRGEQGGRISSSSVSIHCRTSVQLPDPVNMSVKLKIREVKSPSSNSSTTSNGGGAGSQGSDGTPTSTCGATGAGANVTSVGGNSRSNFFGNNLLGRFKTFSHLKLISLFLFRLVVKFWSVCTTALFIILLIFWFYGGLITLLLVIISLMGK